MGRQRVEDRLRRLSGHAPCPARPPGALGGNAGFQLPVGVDLGGSWGTSKVEFNEIRHRTDVVGRLLVAIHSDVEIPRGCCIFTFGLRGVYDYSWSDVLQEQNNAEVQDIQLLGTIGVRF